jgi:cyanophycinase-like exopeptidase
MRALVLALGAGIVASDALAQSHHPGPVILLGDTVEASAVPELATPPGASILLVAGREESPIPLDARDWGGDERTQIVRLGKASEAELDRALLERVRAADLVALGPGTPKEWLDALLERDRPTALTSAVHEAWSGGSTLVGRGDSAALLSAGFVVSGPQELEWDVRNPRDDGGPRAATGLGYQPWALVESEGRSAGSLRRLLRSICNDRIELALYLPAHSALAVEVSEARFTVRGTGAVTIADARRARRLRDRVQGVRLARLPPGAAWDASKRQVESEGDPPADAIRPAGLPALRVDDLFDPLGLSELPERPPRAGSRWVRDDGARQLELRFDAFSRWGRMDPAPGVEGQSLYWVDGLAFDLDSEGL